MAVDKLGVGDIQQLIAGISTASTPQKIQLQKAVIPQVTTTERNALAEPDVFTGMIVYNTTTNKLNFRTAAGAWEAITSA